MRKLVTAMYLFILNTALGTRWPGWGTGMAPAVASMPSLSLYLSISIAALSPHETTDALISHSLKIPFYRVRTLGHPFFRNPGTRGDQSGRLGRSGEGGVAPTNP